MSAAETDVATTTINPPRELHTPLRAYLALALGAVCIGFSAIFTKWAHIEGPVSGFYRVAIATVALAVPYAVHTVRLRRLRQAGRNGLVELPVESVLGVTILAGAFFALDLALWNSSLLFTNAANATLLANTSTLWVSLGAMLIFHESLKRRFWFGMLLALGGAAIIMGRDILQHHTLGWGDLLAVGSSIFYAGYLLSTQRARRHLDTLSFMWLSSFVASVALLAYCLAAGLKMAGFTFEQYMALVALGLISHVVGWLAINYSLGHLPAAIAAVSLLSQPVITAIIAVPLLNEAVTIFQVAGGVLVLAGIYIVNRR